MYEAKFRISKHGGDYWTSAKSISDLKDGFWVNQYGQFTKMFDCKYYILPHMIDTITKLDV